MGAGPFVVVGEWRSRCVVAFWLRSFSISVVVQGSLVDVLAGLESSFSSFVIDHFAFAIHVDDVLFAPDYYISLLVNKFNLLTIYSEILKVSV